jgi:hypothetical protein
MVTEGRAELFVDVNNDADPVGAAVPGLNVN